MKNSSAKIDKSRKDRLNRVSLFPYLPGLIYIEGVGFTKIIGPSRGYVKGIHMEMGIL
jgi:hypothetical protein